MKTILFTFLILENIICIWGRADQQIDQWNAIVATKELPEIAQLIEHSDAMPWPKLISNESMNLKVNAAYRPSDMGNALLVKIRSYERSTLRDESSSEKAATVYGALSRGLQSSGGYINLCLADAANRLALARLAELLINNPSSVDKVKAVLDSLMCVRFSTERFVQMIQDEPVQKIDPNINLMQLQTRDAKKQIFSILGTTSDQIDYLFITNHAGTSVLIDNISIGVLLDRMGQSDFVAQALLAALIDFVKHGGQYGEIRLDDVRPFRAIMQGREKMYGSDLMGIPATNVGLMVGLMKQLKKDDSNNMLVTIALQ